MNKRTAEREELKNETTSYQGTIINSFISNSFWGIDKVTLHRVSVNKIDQIKLEQAEANDKRNCKVKRGKITSTALRNIEYLQIFDKAFGDLKIGFTPMNTIFCILGIINPKEGNVETVGIVGLHNRVAGAINYIDSNYGISLDCKRAEYESIEVAFTAVFQNQIPLRPRIILMDALGDARKSSRLIGNSKDRTDFETVHVKNFKPKKTAIEYILYDKTKEMENKKESDGMRYPLPIYRFEMRLNSKEAIKSRFNATRFASPNELSDQLIIAYIENKLLPKMQHNYIKRFKESIKFAKSIVKSRPSNAKAGWFRPILFDYVSKEPDSDNPRIIDEEAFIYASEGKKNGARTIRRIMEFIDKSSDTSSGAQKNPLARMDGWIAEDFMNEMLQALSYGLGTPANISFSSGIPVFYEDDTAKKQYFNYLRQKKKLRLE